MDIKGVLDRWFIGYFFIAIFTVIVAFIYYQGVNGPLVFDDFRNIVDNESVHWTTIDIEKVKEAVFQKISGPTGRPLAMLSLALNYYFGQLDPYGYKLFNIAIHLINTIILFWLTRNLLWCWRLSSSQSNLKSESEIQRIAILATILWAIHPFNLTSVLYVVQRMASMSTTFMLLSIGCYIKFRLLGITSDKAGFFRILLVFLFVMLGLGCKENAVLAIPVCLVIEWTLFQFHTANLKHKYLLTFWLSAVVLLILTVFIYIIFNWSEKIVNYDDRPFNLNERVLTQTRVLWFYIRLILFPEVNQMGTYHDDFQLSKNLFEPITTIISSGAWFLVVCTAFFLKKKLPLLTFGIGWFLVGHLLESTIIALELIHEHRNYFPSVGLFILFSYYLFELVKIKKKLGMILIFLLVLSLGFALDTRVNLWSSWSKLAISEVTLNPNSSRAHQSAARYYFWIVQYNKETLKKEISIDDPAVQKAREHLTKSYQLMPYNILGLVSLIRLNDLIGMPVESEWVEVLQDRLEHTHLRGETFRPILRLMESQMDSVVDLPPYLYRLLVVALEKNPNITPHQLSLLYFQTGLLTNNFGLQKIAIEYFSKSLELNPKIHQTYLALASVYVTTNQLDQAKLILDKLIVTELSTTDKKSYQNLEKIIKENAELTHSSAS